MTRTFTISFHSFEVGFGLDPIGLMLMGIRCFHSFEVGFGPGPGKRSCSPVLTGFHSFEVGFGQTWEQYRSRVYGSFHSFEVGFGLLTNMIDGRVVIGFHSFEVGFGQEKFLMGNMSFSQFSFLRGRLRTRTRQFPT